MRTMSLRTRITSASVAVIGIAVAITLFWSSSEQSQTPETLRIIRQKIGNAESGITALATNVIADFYREAYPPAQRAEFHITSSQPVAIGVEATGVQIRTDSGWEGFSEVRRGETWRLKPGIVRDLFVERPQKETKQIWRAYVRFGNEMRGPKLWYWQLRGAWQDRSFANWTGKAWGGGRFTGANELFSEEFSK